MAINTSTCILNTEDLDWVQDPESGVWVGVINMDTGMTVGQRLAYIENPLILILKGKDFIPWWFNLHEAHYPGGSKKVYKCDAKPGVTFQVI